VRVLLVGPYPIPPRASTGGIETAVSLLAGGLAAVDDVEVHVATVAFAPPHSGQRDGGVRLHVLRSRQATSQVRRYRQERLWLGRVAEAVKPDVVHVHGTNFYGAACTQLSYPTLVTVHGLLRREAQLDFSDTRSHWRYYRRAKGALNAQFERNTLAQLRDVITISPYIERELADGKRRLHPVPNPVSDHYYRLPKQAVPGRILFVGAIHARKGLTWLVRALAPLRGEIPDLRLVIVGHLHSPDYLRAVDDEISRSQLCDVVEMRGHISDRELDQEYTNAALVVLPSQEETAPFAIQQAMAAATPVVATRVGGIPEIVDHGKTGLLVPYNDDAALTHALRQLLSDTNLAQRMGAGARETARQRFRLSTITEQTLAVYRSVIHRSAPSRGRDQLDHLRVKGLDPGSRVSESQ
jgi:glycosyltransferase involved in cell wall biosynthesis